MAFKNLGKNKNVFNQINLANKKDSLINTGTDQNLLKSLL